LNVQRPLRVMRSFLLLLTLPALSFGQRHVSYSAAVAFGISIPSLHVMNRSGEMCVSIFPNISKLRADGSVAYSVPAPNGFVPVTIDELGNCYLMAGVSVAGGQATTPAVMKLNPAGAIDSSFATFQLPGSVNENVAILAVDSQGNVYIAGTTTNYVDFPVVNGLPHASRSSGLDPSDGFVVKIASDGSHIIYSSYLGGTEADSVNSLAVDSTGASYVAGQTVSTDFPTHAAYLANNPASPVMPGQAPNTSGFVTKFDATGTIVYSTYLGGGDASAVNAIAVDSAGDAYLGGYGGTNFPQLHPLPGNSAGAFLAKLKADGSGLLFSTFYGDGAAANFAVTAISLDGNENVYFAGVVGCSAVGSLQITCGQSIPSGVNGSGVIPEQNPIQRPANGSEDAFLGEINPTGTALLFSSYFGGPGVSGPSGMGVDSAGNITVFGGEGDSTNIGVQRGSAFGRTSYQVPFVNPNSEPYGIGTALFTGNGDRTMMFLTRISKDPGTALSMPTTLDFSGSATPGGVVGQTTPVFAPVQIGNYGSTDIHITAIDVSGDFTGTHNCPTSPAALPAGSSPGTASTFCSISLTFAPTAPGSRTGTITIHDDAPGNPHVIDIVNVVAASPASLTVSPTSLTFDPQELNTPSTAKAVTLANAHPDGGTITLSHVATTGDFNESTTCPTPIQGNSCPILVTFTPTANGTRTGTLTITYSTSNDPTTQTQTVSLTGTGGAPSPTLAPSAPGGDSQTVAAGRPATYTLSASGFTGTINFACSGAPTATTCTVSPASVAAPASGPATVTVTVTTTAHSSLILPVSRRTTPLRVWPLLYLGVLVALLAGLKFLVAQHHNSFRPARLVLAAGILFAVGCGGGSSAGGGSGGTTPLPVVGTPAGTYTLTVTATAGATSQHIPLTLVVQ